MTELLNKICGLIWGAPLMALLIGTGVWLTIVLRGIQFRGFCAAVKLTCCRQKEAEGDISNFQSLMAALSATVGVGNIAGVATAIATGGPGALFWMWCTGIFGMATKYSEALLAVHYRSKLPDGTMGGGPMYYIERGLGQKWLAVLFAVFTVLATFGIGNMTQSNSIAVTLSVFKIDPNLTGIVVAVLTGSVVLGGIKVLGRVTSFLVPVMILFYMGASIAVLVVKGAMIPEIFLLVFRDAFTPQAAVGGFAGTVLRKTIQVGLARGLFSNESGLGSAPIVAAAAKARFPAEQALVSMLQTFIDTLVVCSMTGFAILSTGAWTSGLSGAELTISAFESVFGIWGRLAVSVSLCLFAFSTLIGWGYYGERALVYLVGLKAILPYRVIFTCVVWLGAVLKLETVWTLSDIFNGLMALPNLVALMCLTPVIISETRRYITFITLKPVED